MGIEAGGNLAHLLADLIYWEITHVQPHEELRTRKYAEKESISALDVSRKARKKHHPCKKKLDYLRIRSNIICNNCDYWKMVSIPYVRHSRIEDNIIS